VTVNYQLRITNYSYFRNWLLGLSAVASLAVSPSRRRLWAELRAYERGLPAAVAGPLPQVLAAQTPSDVDLDLPAADVRLLADGAALFERRSPLGLCLRRSLARYHFLRRAGVPLVINFGARFRAGVADREVTGHAWVTLDDEPYYEDGENYRGFTVMLRYPSEAL
jgi:transglutaminase superfamily protein